MDRQLILLLKPREQDIIQPAKSGIAMSLALRQTVRLTPPNNGHIHWRKPLFQEKASQE
jgi:hypothetical protein